MMRKVWDQKGEHEKETEDKCGWHNEDNNEKNKEETNEDTCGKEK
jgi:hypothetical protein